MSSSLFAFELQQLDRIQPWGGPADPTLSWFGLSDGRYWMNVGPSTLFEYSPAARKAGAPRYCEYQVVRLYEDVLSMASHVLEEVPAELRPFIQVHDDLPWDQHWHDWCNLPGELRATEDGVDLLDIGGPWLGQRTLDSAYLAPPASIRMWSDAQHVHIEWDNRERLVNGMPAWTAGTGTHSMAREAFADEVRSFHVRFLAQMGERVEQVVAGGLSRDIRVALQSLVTEQERRSAHVERYLMPPSVPTDWSLVSDAVGQLQRLRCGTTGITGWRP